jgi:hypothetical protein
MQNIQAINLVAERTQKENERERQAVAARVNNQMRERKEAAARADEERRAQAQKELREEVRQHFMRNPWATEADFNDVWKRDKLTMIREYERSRHAIPRM